MPQEWLLKQTLYTKVNRKRHYEQDYTEVFSRNRLGLGLRKMQSMLKD